MSSFPTFLLLKRKVDENKATRGYSPGPPTFVCPRCSATQYKTNSYINSDGRSELRSSPPLPFVKHPTQVTSEYIISGDFAFISKGGGREAVSETRYLLRGELGEDNGRGEREVNNRNRLDLSLLLSFHQGKESKRIIKEKWKMNHKYFFKPLIILSGASASMKLAVPTWTAAAPARMNS